MGTTAQKLEYLGTTKSQLKDMINYGLDDENKITSSTTFRNYVSSIFNAFLEALRTPDTLWGNLPKITGTGTNISLNNTIEAPMRITLSPSELSQDATPTPSSPQAVHTINGSNKVVVNGKNLWSVGDIANVGWATSNNDFKDLLNSLEAGTYTLTLNYKVTNINLVSNTNICGFYIANSNSSISKRKTETSLTVDEIVSYVNTISITSAMVGKFTAVYFYGFGNESNGKTATSDIINNQLEKNTQATTYEPYISQEADIDLGYENLANITSFSAGNRTEVYNNTCYFKNGTYSTASSVALYLNNQTDLILKANQTYTISVICNGKVTASTYKVIYLKIGNQSTINMGSLGSNTRINYQYTPTADEPIKFISFDMGTNQTFEDYSVNIQVEKGSTAHSYTEYGKAINYCKIGTYEDKFIRTSGKNLFETEYILTTANTTNISAHLKKETYTLSLANKPNFGGVIYIQLYKNGTLITTDGHLLNTSSAVSFSTSSYWYYFSNIPNGNYLTFTLDGDYDVKIALANATGTQKAMLNKGTTALDYEPYGSNEWYIKKNIGKVVLDGNITLNYNGTAGQFYNTNQNNIPNYQARTPMLCNYLQYSSTTWVKNCFGITSTNVFWLYIENGPTTLADLQTWLSTHNLDIRYVLATPTYTQITGTLANQLENVYQKLLSYSGTTNISQINNDLSFVLDVEAIEEL